MNKRFIILASVGALILLVGGGLLYWASQKQNQAKPSSAGPTLKKVLDEQVIAPVPAFKIPQFGILIGRVSCFE